MAINDADRRIVTEYINELCYNARHIESCIHEINEIVESICLVYKHRAHVYVLGNGGSASTAQHFAQGLFDAGICATSLSDNIAVVTSLANDIAYADIFSYQIDKLVNANDIVIFISGSGNSKNLLKAMHKLSNMKIKTIAFLGFDGGNLHNKVNKEIIISSCNYGIVEDLHLALSHIISALVKVRINVK